MTRRRSIVVSVLVLACMGVALTAPAHAAAPRERLFATGFDDWEPSVAADSFGHVYIATTRIGVQPDCANCPTAKILYKRSDDGGRTFGPALTLCRCAGFAEQFDPVLVTDARGRLFATWLNDWRVAFARSDDFGRTWTPYRLVSLGVKIADKPWIGVSRSGRDVYVVFNGSQKGDPYAVSSHDAGATWSKPVLAEATPRYSFAGGVAVLQDGTVLSSQDAYHQSSTGDVQLAVLRSVNGGRSWTGKVVAHSAEQRKCPDWGLCGHLYFGPQDAIAADARGTAFLLYNASAVPKGNSRLFLRRSTDGGATWSAATDVSTARQGVDNEFPMIAATGDGDVRIAWMDNRTGRWNVFFRRSLDGGMIWSSDVRLSDRPGGAAYKSPIGFKFPYGDYGQLAIGRGGATWAAWGEGPSWYGPGDVWFTRVP